MNSPRAILLVVLIVCGCAIAIPTAAGPAADTSMDIASSSLQSQQQADQQANNSTLQGDNSTLGEEISSFMQVSTSQAEGSVNTGLWVARFNQTKNKSAQQALVRHHVDDMQTQLSKLQKKKQNLVTAYKHDRISRLKYQAEMSNLIGEISSVRYSINATRPRAVTVGARVDKLNKLDKQARTAGGPEAQEVAKSIHSVRLDGENADNITRGPGTGNQNGSGKQNGTGDGSLGESGGVSLGNGTATNGTVGSGNGSVSVGIGNGQDRGNGNGKRA